MAQGQGALEPQFSKMYLNIESTRLPHCWPEDERGMAESLGNEPPTHPTSELSYQPSSGKGSPICWGEGQLLV